MRNLAQGRWRIKAKNNAAKKIAEKFGITQKEVKEVIALAKEYYQDNVRNINVQGDILNSINRIQIPMFGGYIAVSRALLIEKMYEEGRISEEDWLRISEGPLKKSLLLAHNKINKHNKVKDEKREKATRVS